jgi:hypothetical protein
MATSRLLDILVVELLHPRDGLAYSFAAGLEVSIPELWHL